MEKTFRKGMKFFVIFVFFVAMFIAPAKSLALTAAQIQAEITALQQQLAQLSGELPVTSATAIPSACGEIGFTRNLTLGMSGTDVQCLQALLNQSSDTRVSASGPGSPGSETIYFGSMTRDAVIKFQNKYVADILAPVGLTAGTGYVGSSTRAKLNTLLAAATPTTPSVPTTPSGQTTGGISITGREGTITVSANPTPANGTRIRPGDDKVSVMGIKVLARGSDVSVGRVNLEFDRRPNDYLSRIYLYDGSVLLVSLDLNSGTVSRLSSTLYTVTLDNFDTPAVIRKDASKVLTVKVDAQSSISTSRLPQGASQNLEIRVAANGVRALDQARLNEYGPNNNTAVVRTINIRQSATTNASMVIGLSGSTPPSANLSADSQGNVDDVKLLVFSVRAEDDDLTITEIDNVQFNTGSGYLVPDTAYLVDDNDDIIATASPSKSSGLVDFQDLDTTISQNKSRLYTIRFDDRISTSGSDDGKKYRATVRALDGSNANFVVENSSGDTLDANRIKGSATSNIMTVFLSSSSFTLGSVTTTSTPRTDTASPTISATFTIPVTAGGGDIYIAKTGAFRVFYSRNDVLPGALATSIVYAKPNNVTSLTNSYRIAKGSTATFVIHATYVLDGPAGSYKLYMSEIDWGTSDSAPTANQSTYVSEDFVSDYKYLQ